MITQQEWIMDLDRDCPNCPCILTEVEIVRILYLYKRKEMNELIKQIPHLYEQMIKDGVSLEDEDYFDA